MALAGSLVMADDFPWRATGPGLAMLRLTNDGPVVLTAVRIDRDLFRRGEFNLVTTLASNQVTGTETLPKQISSLPRDLGIPVAAINADFFMMSGSAKGDPRGLHIWHESVDPVYPAHG
jgi:hypothetical protein